MNDHKCVIFFGGLIFLQYLVKILKNILKIDRPIKSNTYGMPSTKSATLSYILIFLILQNKTMKFTIKIKLIFLTFIGLLYKLYYNEHSVIQILSGLIIGIIYGYIVYYIFNN
jgi:acid phosphatase family membrane protein YuiD